MAEKTIHIDKDPQLPEFFSNSKRNHGGQTVPTDFFEQFEKKMNAVIDAEMMVKETEKKVETPQIQWYRQRRTWMSMAASFALILVIGLAMHVDHIGHKLQDVQQVDQFANSNEMFDLDDPNLELPEMVEESYLATTNDYELYEFYCEI